ncbi:hypothetical protein [Leucobacter soli]|uniref:hypothetical protein n=1 Tax=Leucobacter soli TaxID=2812850 RepID=UPI00360E0554
MARSDFSDTYSGEVVVRDRAEEVLVVPEDEVLDLSAGLGIRLGDVHVEERRGLARIGLVALLAAEIAEASHRLHHPREGRERVLVRVSPLGRELPVIVSTAAISSARRIGFLFASGSGPLTTILMSSVRAASMNPMNSTSSMFTLLMLSPSDLGRGSGAHVDSDTGTAVHLPAVWDVTD